LDIIPDITPIWGYVDDGTVLAGTITFLGSIIKPEHLKMAEEETDSLFKKFDWL